ncbi:MULTISPECIES: 7-carboxy-7-deazaguanine synthase QueE [Bacillus]|jgi:7-carboxy-7-deazaguanine synthase|uniref:7-carboxy-7-deazaguanine synthase QueE n=1 Tax=Bacillus TaxID=1386 RepID=UPI002E2227A0|nr:7-carboxy-7-deazaguanine synthase QueE [Bacillus smithii]
MAKKVPVLEIFGPTIQGEGSVIGQKTMFVRTAGCDYSCSWCDSAFTWDGSAKADIRQMTAEEIWKELKQLGGDCFSHVTISGGNPALISGLSEFIDLLKEEGIRIGLETQGSRWQDWFWQIDDLTISPKPPSSGMKTNFFVLDDIVKKLQAKNHQTFSLKVVIFDDRDFDYAVSVHQRYPSVPFFVQVGNDDPATTDDDQLIKHLLTKMKWLVEKISASAEMNDVRALPQLHTLLWGNKRGV